MGLSVSNLHIDTALTNVSVMYRNLELVAEEVLPEVPVAKQTDKYYKYGQDNMRVDDDTFRPGGISNQIEWSLSTDPYYCDGHALHALIPDGWRENADAAIDLDTDMTVALTDKILLNREVAVKAAVDAGATEQSQALTPWDNDDIDPVKIVEAAKETIELATGVRPNRLLLPRPVFRAARNNAQIKARITGAPNLPASLVTAQQLAEVFEVDKVVVAGAVKGTSAEGQAFASSYVWGKDALLYCMPSSPGLRTVSFGYLFTWNVGRFSALVSKGRMPDLQHSDYIEASRFYDAKIVAAAAGVRFSGCVA